MIALCGKWELAVEDNEGLLMARETRECGDGKCTNLTWYISFVVGFSILALFVFAVFLPLLGG